MSEEPKQSWYRHAVEESPIPIFLVNRRGEVLAWNAAFADRHADPPSARGRPCTRFLRTVQPPRLGTYIERVFRGETIRGLELTWSVEGRPSMTMLTRLYPVHRDGRDVTGCVIATMDVTELRQYERELITAKEEAEKAVRLKTHIINNTSHEIRTPLTAIMGFTEILLDEVPETQREFVQLIHSSGVRLMNTLNSVLDFARLESGDVEIRQEEMDLCAEVREISDMFRGQADAKGIALEVACQREGAIVHLDRGGLMRVLNNLISNAVKFTARGSVRVTVEVCEGRACVRVKDTGIGIGEAFLPDLFQEFKQESEGIGRRHEGSGLGLAITRRLVELMDGTITVESEKGQGTTFTVCFPSSGC